MDITYKQNSFPGGKVMCKVVKGLHHKVPNPDSFTEKFYLIFMEEIISVLLKMFLNVHKEGKLLNSF